MSETNLPNIYEYVDLTREFAQEHVDELVELANTIPLITYTAESILDETKDGRQHNGKWLHGLAVVKDCKIIGFVGAYERLKEDNEQYPENTLYISELAVNEAHRNKGIATELMHLFIKKNDSLGLKVLDGKLNYSLQTNSADWNKPVINFYKSLGFKQRATKQYEDRLDLILSL